MSKEPANPRLPHIQEIANALSPSRTQHRHPVFSPSNAPAASPYMPPSQHRPGVVPQPPGMPPLPSGPPQYPTASPYGAYAPAPPPPPTVPGMPPLPGYPPAPAQSMYSQQPLVPGFNPTPAPIAPPPIAPVAPIAPTPPLPPSAMPSTYSNYTSYSQANVPAPPSAMTPVQSYRPHLQVNWKPLDPAPVTLPNGLPGVASGAPARPPSTAPLQHQQEHREPPQVITVSLNAEDQAIIDKFYHLIEAVVSVNKTPVALHKAEEAKTRLGCELAPRLAAGRLTMGTRQLLWQCGEQASRGDYRGAIATCGHMVRAGGDFVEVSAFVPALKSLFSLAQSTFAR
ncbi:hypothetical protein ANCCEY_00532 [Ancylostoma ceylanicum]|uniref:Uncharacterized protein n=1 Tax=Ancylostoma ceylanicum TaxID=53326 RepID=A0A0D6M8J5_9BILA|nr:hypothetical protein ANCCEY_00532 [Ancylostoma ceylanicum]